MFTDREMSPARPLRGPAPTAVAAADRVAVTLGSAIRAERLRRRWTLRDLAARAAVSVGSAYAVEAGTRASLEMYARLTHALGLRLQVDLLDPRLRSGAPRREEDLVHSAMGELEAVHLRALGYTVAIDEPYQHYQFAGRADVLAWSADRRALLHIENRTRFPNLQDAAASYNAKRAYLAPVIAERLGLRGGFECVTHVMAVLWSAEVMHSLRLRSATFRSLCPDATAAFEAWWAGRPPHEDRSSTLVVLDPFARGRQRQWVDLETALDGVRPRVRGYAEAVARLTTGGGIGRSGGGMGPSGGAHVRGRYRLT